MKQIIEYFDSEARKESWKLELELNFFGRGKCAICQVEKDLVLAERLIEENGKVLDNQPINMKCFKHARFIFRRANNNWDKIYSKPFFVSPDYYKPSVLRDFMNELRNIERELILPREDRWSPHKGEVYYKKKGLKWSEEERKKDIKDRYKKT